MTTMRTWPSSRNIARWLAVAGAAALTISAGAFAAVRVTGPRAADAMRTVAPAPRYSDDLNGQVAEIAQAARQDLADHRVAFSRADGAAGRFADALGGALHEPLTEEQFNAVIRSLRGAFIYGPYKDDATDLEMEWYTLIWTDMIQRYVERKPITPAEERLLRQQVEELVTAVQSVSEPCLDSSETREMPGFLAYLRRLLNADLDDPVRPYLKRPFAEAEIAELQRWVTRQIPDQMRRWHALRTYLPGQATGVIGPIINELVLRRIEAKQYTLPLLSRDRMKQLWAQRTALLRAESKWLDQRDQRELAAQRAREAEELRRQEAAKAVPVQSAAAPPAKSAPRAGPGPAADSIPRPRLARPGDLALSITLLTKDGAVTAHEPLLARVTLKNQAEEVVSVEIIHRLGISDASGRLVAATPAPPRPGNLYGVTEYFYGLWEPKPGESRTVIWVVSSIYQFTKPGLYTVRAQYFGPPREFSVLAEASAPVRALPFDATRLKARCEELIAPLRPDGGKYGELEIGIRSKALLSVRHDIALPYLDWLVRHEEDSYAIRAMRRIGTPKAQALVRALAASKDKVGRTARRGMKIPLDLGTWDVGLD